MNLENIFSILIEKLLIVLEMNISKKLPNNIFTTLTENIFLTKGLGLVLPKKTV